MTFFVARCYHISMALQDEIRNEQKKLKDMTFSGKVRYILYYYKIHILVAILLLIVVVVFTKDWMRARRPAYLNAVAVNTVLSYDLEDGDILSDYVSFAGVDTKAYNCTIDTSLQMEIGAGDQMTMASQQKILGLFSAQEVDVIMAPEEVADYYAPDGAFIDMRTFLKEDEIKAFADAGYPVYYVADGGTSYPAGFYITDSQYLKNKGEHGTFIPEDLPVFAFASCIKNTDAALQLLEMITK